MLGGILRHSLENMSFEWILHQISIGSITVSKTFWHQQDRGYVKGRIKALNSIGVQGKVLRQKPGDKESGVPQVLNLFLLMRGDRIHESEKRLKAGRFEKVLNTVYTTAFEYRYHVNPNMSRVRREHHKSTDLIFKYSWEDKHRIRKNAQPYQLRKASDVWADFPVP